ncbi:MAG: hypothetical protein KIT54_00500 [Phycisphaeraceae bacterium]|nr:hypothetical protein [Phycisphaeraceae bacterium]
MRILISNPDTIGDVVLREPLFRVLAQAGHELALVVRPLAQPLARVMAPGARLIELPFDVYDGKLDSDDERFEPVARAALDFEPDVFVGVPFTWTALEVRLGGELIQARRIGQAGGRYRDSWLTREQETQAPFDEIVRVNEDLHEVRKNEALARAVLGEPVHLDEPRLTLDASLDDAADAVLAGLGLERGGFLATCVGHHKHTAIRNWRPERWAEALAHWMGRHGRSVLLMGSADEAEVSREIGDALEAKGFEPRHWFGGPEGDTLRMAALLNASRGYVGRDTGPMHVAAALGKPVLAVFGGGTWPRFRPMVAPSVSVTLAVPCSPCDWRCDLRRSQCIQDVPVGEVVAQIDRLEAGQVSGAEVRQIEPSRAMLVSIAGDLAHAARKAKGELAAMRGKLADRDEHVRRATMNESAVLQRLDRLEQAVQKSTRAEEAERRASEVTQKLTQHTQALQSAREDLARAIKRAETADEQIASLKTELDRVRLEAERQRNDLAMSQQRAMQLEQQRNTAEDEAAALRAKYADVDLEKLRADLSAARQLAGRVQGENNDLRLHVERVTHERRAMEKLAEQRMDYIRALEGRLADLLASRWRQIGQRLHVAMTLPWEEDERKRLLGSAGNGQHAPR